MNIGNSIVLFIAAVVLAVGAMLGLFDLSVMPLLGNLLVAATFTYVGVMLGRRSDSANAYADRVDARLREYEAKLLAAQDELRKRGIELP